MPDPFLTVLGVDTSLRSSGFGVVTGRGNQLQAEAFGVIKNPASRRHSECLKVIHTEIRGLIERYEVRAMAVEGAFFAKNAKTAMILGQARGVVLAAGAEADIPVYEYAPRRVKQALVGTGSAGKGQVASMVARLLGVREAMPDDASDALAIAICHLHSRTGIRELAPKQI
jgi:crossover junction endodeoxyribonuclease RuvC